MPAKKRFKYKLSVGVGAPWAPNLSYPKNKKMSFIPEAANGLYSPFSIDNPGALRFAATSAWRRRNAPFNRSIGLSADLTRKWEGYIPKARYNNQYEYDNGILTVGHGRTNLLRPELQEGEYYSPERANEALYEDIALKTDPIINQAKSNGAILTPNQEAAARSFLYSIGTGTGSDWDNSSAKMALMSGDIETFEREAYSPEYGFVRQGGKILQGLVNRRGDEWDLSERPTDWRQVMNDVNLSDLQMMNVEPIDINQEILRANKIAEVVPHTQDVGSERSIAHEPKGYTMKEKTPKTNKKVSDAISQYKNSLAVGSVISLGNSVRQFAQGLSDLRATEGTPEPEPVQKIKRASTMPRYQRADQALDEIKRGFNSSVRIAREMGKPELIPSLYASMNNAIQGVEQQLGDVNLKESANVARVNSDANMQLAGLNANIDAQNIERALKFDAMKAQARNTNMNLINKSLSGAAAVYPEAATNMLTADVIKELLDKAESEEEIQSIMMLISSAMDTRI